MKKLFLCTCAAMLSLAAASLCLAADSPWTGTWKSNQAKSKLSGDTFSITMKADETYHYSNESTMEYDFACDGKPYSTFANSTVTCTGTPDTGFDFTWLANGTVASKSHRTLSADGKKMTIEGTSMRQDGTTTTYTDTYTRISGTTGMAGKWKTVKEKVSGSYVIIIAVSGDMMHLEYPANKETIDAKLDGSDSPMIGPTIPKGILASFKADGPNKMQFLVKYNDKVLSEGIHTLSADGKTFTLESWSPGKKSEKETVLYEKQ